MEKAVDLSRVYSQKTLQHILNVSRFSKSCPQDSEIKAEDNKFLLDQIRCVSNALSKIDFSNYSFQDDFIKQGQKAEACLEKKDFSEANLIYRDFFEKIDDAKKELQNSIVNTDAETEELKDFESFGNNVFGSQENRKQFNDSIKSAYNDLDYKCSFENVTGNALSEAAHSVLNPDDVNYKRLLEYAKSQDGLGDDIQNEIAQWTENTDKLLKEENPFVQEEVFVDDFKQKEANSVQKDFSKIEQDYSSIDSVKKYPSDVHLDFYHKTFAENIVVKGKKNQEQVSYDNNIHHRTLAGYMENELNRRKTEWELEQIEKQKEKLFKDLYDKIQKYKKIQEQLKSFTQDSGKMWKLAQGDLRDNGFKVLEKFAFLLSDAPGLKELCDLIGRYQAEVQKYHKVLREITVSKSYFKPEPAPLGVEVSGVTVSDEIPHALPAELALYVNKNPLINKIFKLKFAQHQLLSYEYIDYFGYSKNETETIEDIEQDGNDSAEKKGPMIICVDTSGSMTGEPERVAKTVAFALAQKSLEEERPCYLISFSDNYEPLDLSSYLTTDGISNLVDFLQKGFYGGTDPEPALRGGIKLMNENKWERADLLMISDFEMGNLSPDLKNVIESQKKKKSRFFSLKIGTGANQNVLNCFDEQWEYNPQSQDAVRSLAKNMVDMNRCR